MRRDKRTSTSPLGSRYRTCPGCGELMDSGTSQCRHCGMHFDPSGAPVHIAPEQAVVKTSINPPSFGGKFNPSAFSWPAFFFADLWHAEKGLFKQAWRHYLVRLISGIFWFLALLLIFYSTKDENFSDMNSVTVAIAIGCGLLALLTGFIAMLGAMSDASRAHKRLYELVNSRSTDELAEMRAKGRSVYMNMLLVPYYIFVFMFLIALLTQL